MGNIFKVDENVKLLPCPFCGGKAYLTGIFIPTVDGEINAYQVGCKKCGIDFTQDWDYDRIVEKWNRRACKCKQNAN